MNNSTFLEINDAALSQAAEVLPVGAPFQMLNLLRYRERADYGAAGAASGADTSPCSGREAYFERYVAAFNAVAASEKIEGIEVFWLGEISASLVAPAGEAWHDAVIVQYPSFAAFRRLTESAQSRSEAAPHRLAALADWRLLAAQPHQTPDAKTPDAKMPDAQNADAKTPDAQNADAEATWKTYQSAWEEVGDDERRALLERSVAPDCVYTDPMGETHGYAELIAYIEKFRGALPGATFRNHEFAPHHGHSLAVWTRYDASGRAQSEGTSYAHFGADGRLTRVAGFFKAPGAVPDEDELAVWKTYQSAWSDIGPDERSGLLARSVAPDGTYADPTDERAGRAELSQHIESSQQKTPGASFQNDDFITHHGQALSAWTMRDGQGATVAKGHSYARFGADGLLTQMTGFFQKA